MPGPSKKPAHLFVMTCLTTVLFASGIYAQSRTGNKVMNLQNFDNKIIHFGFLLGINSADFRITYNPDYFGTDTIIKIDSKKQSGFNLGIVSDLRLGEYFNLRFIPALSFSSRKVLYTIIENNQIVDREKDVESTYLDFPLYIKYKSERYNNFRTYVFLGCRYSIDMASQKEVNSKLVKDIIIKVEGTDVLIDFGIGFDFYLNYFKFSPEIHFAVSPLNILVKEDNILNRPIDRLSSRILSLYLNFE